MSVSAITNNISDLGIANSKTSSAVPIDVENTLNKGAAPVDLGAPVLTTETEGSSKVTLSVQSLTFGRLDSNGSTIEATVTEINLANPDQSATRTGQPVDYTRQLADDAQRVLNGDPLSGEQGQNSSAFSQVDVNVSSHGASTAEVDQFLGSLASDGF
jgi:hypothetical protein